MPVEYDRLMSHRIPEVRQRLTRRDTVFYALSVGLGQDPTDPRQLDYVDADRALRALPAMAVVLAHPGFWLADPATGVDAVRLVHGEQGLRLYGELPTEGTLIGRSRITGLVDKGPGRGALLYSERDILDADGGRLLATSTMSVFLRGDGGFGGPSGPVAPPHPMPDGPPASVLDFPTRPEQALYYRLNGDDNPLHADPAVAEAAGFPRPILHGLCTYGVLCHAVVRALCDYDPARLRGLDLRFTAPVFPGETLRAEIWRDGSFRARVVERDVVVANNGRAVLA